MKKHLVGIAALCALSASAAAFNPKHEAEVYFKGCPWDPSLEGNYQIETYKKHDTVHMFHFNSGWLSPGHTKSLKCFKSKASNQCQVRIDKDDPFNIDFNQWVMVVWNYDKDHRGKYHFKVSDTEPECVSYETLDKQERQELD